MEGDVEKIDDHTRGCVNVCGAHQIQGVDENQSCCHDLNDVEMNDLHIQRNFCAYAFRHDHEWVWNHHHDALNCLSDHTQISANN